MYSSVINIYECHCSSVPVISLNRPRVHLSLARAKPVGRLMDWHRELENACKFIMVRHPASDFVLNRGETLRTYSNYFIVSDLSRTIFSFNFAVISKHISLAGVRVIIYKCM